jgi:hypothetical protein
MEELTLLETIEWAQHPFEICAGQPIIQAANFESLSNDLSSFKEVTLTSAEILAVLIEQSKRFTACGGNNAEVSRFGVVRKMPKSGWKYLIDIFVAK